MSDGLLPNRVNLRKAVTRSARYSGAVSLEQMHFRDIQLAPQNVGDEAGVKVVVEFGEDDEHQQYANVELEAEVVLECQRCLQPVTRRLSSSSRLGLVRTEEEARQLPAGYEAWLVVDEVDLWRVAAEEFALAMPVVAYHEIEDCASLLPASDNGQEENSGDSVDSGGGPFSVLSALLANGDDSGEDSREE